MKDYVFLGLVKGYDPVTKMATVEQRNKIVIGDQVEVFGPKTDFFEQRIEMMLDEDGSPIAAAPHAQQIIQIKMERPVKEHFMIRRKV